MGPLNGPLPFLIFSFHNISRSLCPQPLIYIVKRQDLDVFLAVFYCQTKKNVFDQKSLNLFVGIIEPEKPFSSTTAGWDKHNVI